ncbi:MAG: methyltransferase domain-containing protein [Candidatus Thermoplasmatota archaeon]|nr:methyltransferase domain-containing protein [Candidatus Thermoplasmatota archaeon]
MTEFTALREDDGRTYIVPLQDEQIKIKGIGRFSPMEVLKSTQNGERVTIGQKVLTKVKVGLPELRKGMKRRAQIINPKDAGFLLAWMGIGAGQTVLEAGHGSGGLALHLANVLGENGTLVSVENRPEHAEVGRENMSRASNALKEFPNWTLIEGDVADVSFDEIVDEFDAIILDLPEPWPVISELSKKLRYGGRIACYCPVSSQLEKAWEACEEAGLKVDWAGEMMERVWTKASRGGVRPGNTPMGHTAFLLIAERT